MAISQETFRVIINTFIKTAIPKHTQREIEIPLNTGKIIVIAGARRVGKTFLLYSIIDKLRKKMASSRLVYLNLEDDRLAEMSLSDFDTFLEGYYALYPENRTRTVYFFFDEIQQAPSWEKFIRRIYDTEKCRIFLTGSSSRLLSKEIATGLRGRTLTYELFPYSFREYAATLGLDSDYYLSTAKSKLEKAFQQYILNTTFPELILMPPEQRRLALKDYLDLIIFRDLIERYETINTYTIKYLIRYLLQNAGNFLSVNKVYNDLKSQGIKVGKDTLYSYMDNLEDVYAFFIVPLFTSNLREQQRNPGKLYLLDNGLKKLVSIQPDKGRMLENAVFLELRRSCSQIFYYKKEQEVDLLTEKQGQITLYNVCYNIADSKTRDREIAGLQHACNELGINHARILIMDGKEETLKHNKLQIDIAHAMKWFLS